MQRESTAVINRDSFLEPLGFGELATKIEDSEQQDTLYRLTTEYLAEQGAVETEPPSGTALNELPFKMPGLPITVRLSQPTKEELGALLGILFLIFGAGAPLASVTLTGAMAALTRIKRLRTQYGETSLVEAVSEADPSTLRNILLVLYGKPCRHPKAGCRFMTDSQMCQITLEQVEKTIGSLEERKVIHKLNAVEPFEYGIVL